MSQPFPFLTGHSTSSPSVESVCVCVCHYSYPQEDQPRTASRCYLIFRFGSFSDTSVSYKTLKAPWFCGLFSLQRRDSSDNSWTQLGKCLGMQWKPPAGAVTSSVAPIKHARPTFSRPHHKNHNGTITLGFTNLYFLIFL